MNLESLRELIDVQYPELEIDLEIVRDGRPCELVVSSPLGTQAVVRSAQELYRWFGRRGEEKAATPRNESGDASPHSKQRMLF